jgi:hypothetical protein
MLLIGVLAARAAGRRQTWVVRGLLRLLMPDPKGQISTFYLALSSPSVLSVIIVSAHADDGWETGGVNRVRDKSLTTMAAMLWVSFASMEALLRSHLPNPTPISGESSKSTSDWMAAALWTLLPPWRHRMGFSSVASDWWESIQWCIFDWGSRYWFL